MHKNHVVHFAINADQVERAKTFYTNVFGWSFQEWGPPNFYLIQTGNEENPGIRGALQKREEAITGTGMTGFECTISVENIDDSVSSIDTHGGTILMAKVDIPTVGLIAKFSDTEGNIACVIQYHDGVA